MSDHRALYPFEVRGRVRPVLPVPEDQIVNRDPCFHCGCKSNECTCKGGPRVEPR